MNILLSFMFLSWVSIQAKQPQIKTRDVIYLSHTSISDPIASKISIISCSQLNSSEIKQKKNYIFEHEFLIDQRCKVVSQYYTFKEIMPSIPDAVVSSANSIAGCLSVVFTGVRAVALLKPITPQPLKGFVGSFNPGQNQYNTPQPPATSSGLANVNQTPWYEGWPSTWEFQHTLFWPISTFHWCTLSARIDQNGILFWPIKNLENHLNRYSFYLYYERILNIAKAHWAQDPYVLKALKTGEEYSFTHMRNEWIIRIFNHSPFIIESHKDSFLSSLEGLNQESYN